MTRTLAQLEAEAQRAEQLRLQGEALIAQAKAIMAGLGPELQAHRLQAGLSQSSLARSAGLTPSYVSMLESGARDYTPQSFNAMSAAIKHSTARDHLAQARKDQNE